MNAARLAFVLSIVASTSTGCGMVHMQQPGMPGGYPGAAPGGQAAAAPKVVLPKESQDQIRKSEQDAYARADDQQDEQLDRLEKEALKAVKSTLGQEKWADHLPMPLPASQSIAALRKQNVKMRLEPVLNPVSGQANEDFLQFKDEPTDRLGLLSRKSAEGSATAAEKKEMMGYQKISFKLMDLRMQVLNTSMATMQANSHVQTAGMTQMLRVSQLVRSRKLYEMELDARDISLVKRGLERQKRAEAIAAVTMAMTAAYQAVLNNGGDPKALDMIAEASLKAFPLKATVTDDDAKKYVASLDQNVAKVKKGYEAMLRKTWGDAKYERQFKANIDQMFAQAESAQSQKSINQIVQGTNDTYTADVGKCMRGETVSPSSMVGGGTCKSLRRAAQTGDTSDLPPGAVQAFEKNGGTARNAKAAAGVNTAGAIASGDVDGALDGSAKMFGENTTVGASLQGISALKRGDAKGAINAALAFAPPGVKDVFGFASKLLFKG
ncbi:MAG: hypothetical protein JST00_31945 [Deltaproteobacteria bacterium]|nr:hypothetical protein [Deltaproteobacteria bacterium]